MEENYTNHPNPSFMKGGDYEMEGRWELRDGGKEGTTRWRKGGDYEMEGRWGGEEVRR